MAKNLDEIDADFRDRPLDGGPYTHVWADALTMKVRGRGRVVTSPASSLWASTQRATVRSSDSTWPPHRHRCARVRLRGEIDGALAVADPVDRIPVHEADQAALADLVIAAANQIPYELGRLGPDRQ